MIVEFSYVHAGESSRNGNVPLASDVRTVFDVLFRRNLLQTLVDLFKQAYKLDPTFRRKFCRLRRTVLRYRNIQVAVLLLNRHRAIQADNKLLRHLRSH